MKKQIYSKNGKTQENKGFFQKEMIFLQPFVQQQIEIFLQYPKRRLIQENQEKEYQETLKTSKGRRNEEKT